MERNETENKRYICLVRASDASEGTTSTEAQLTYLKQYAQRTGMIYVDEVVLNSVTGSLPGKREDLQRLLDRKRDRDDFDFILVQRLDRLTRGGSDHGFWIEHECKKVGVRIIFVGDDIPDGRYANLIKVAKYESAQEQAFSISQRSTQGAQLALEEGRNITSAHTPHGCWRLYMTADGKPCHIVTDLGDGRQQKLDPQTRSVIDTYGQIGGGGKGHYRKQKSERVLLMPGFADEADTVREIFDLHFRQGFGGKRIADVFNRRGILSPQGKQWSQHQVEVIYENEVYTGRSIGNRTSSAIYHERSANSPKQVKLDEETRTTAKNIPVRQRPQSEWFVQIQPLMEEFLDAGLRKIAMAAHDRIWQHRFDPDRPKMSKSKHAASDYLLTGLLHAKQDGEPLVGVLCGRVGKKVRYYRHRRGNRDYIKGGIFSKMIQAKPLEDAVINVVAQILTNEPDLHARIVQLIKNESTKAEPTERLAELREKRDRIAKRTNLIVSTLDEETLADAQTELNRLKAERKALDEQIQSLMNATAVGTVDPLLTANAIIDQLRNMTANIRQMPTFALRQTITSVIEKIFVDMQTKSVEIQLTLPLSIASDAKTSEKNDASRRKFSVINFRPDASPDSTGNGQLSLDQTLKPGLLRLPTPGGVKPTSVLRMPTGARVALQSRRFASPRCA